MHRTNQSMRLTKIIASVQTAPVDKIIEVKISKNMKKKRKKLPEQHACLENFIWKTNK